MSSRDADAHSMHATAFSFAVLDFNEGIVLIIWDMIGGLESAHFKQFSMPNILSSNIVYVKNS